MKKKDFNAICMYQHIQICSELSFHKVPSLRQSIYGANTVEK